MEQKKIPEFKFLSEDEKGTKKILQSELIDFLEINGFHNLLFDGENTLVRDSNQILRRVSILEVIDFLRTTFESNDLREYYDVFADQPTRYLGASKLLLLKTIDLIDDRDQRDSSRLFFRNGYYEITSKNLTIRSYETLEGYIWQSRIIDRNFELPLQTSPGQFEQWCTRITGNSLSRFKALQSILGYLLHRNKEKGENKAIILYDEKMGDGNQANGRVGKTLLGKAIQQCREVVMNDGKTKNMRSNFANQLINSTTDCVYFDDLSKGANFETFYSFITTGLDVEKKYKSAFRIDETKSPKLIISSNHYVLGDGGDSDLGRRYEFEVCNYYSADFTPEMEFGNRFFDNAWPIDEWNKFFHFMMGCIQIYLKNGLIEAEPINLPSNKIKDATSPDFLEFGETYFKEDQWLDKRQLLIDFQALFPQYEDMTSNMFTRWSQQYARQKELDYEYKTAGGNTTFKFNTRKDGDE